MFAKNMEEMKNIEKGNEMAKKSVAYVKEFLKENGTSFQDRLIYEKNVGRDEGRSEGRNEGLAEGKRDNAIETVKNMLLDKVDTKKIAQYTGLSVQQIEALE